MSLMCKKCLACEAKEGFCRHEWTVMILVVIIMAGVASKFIFHVI